MSRHHPVDVSLIPELHDRNRLTTFFRLVLAIPHLILVGGPVAAIFPWLWGTGDDGGAGFGSGGVMGLVAGFCAIVAWFAIVFTARHPPGLWKLETFYLRWRVRAVSYFALLQDDYPPFGDALYPVVLEISEPLDPRDRLGVGFRILLALPHILAVGVLSMAWCLTTIVAWFAILITGSYPAVLYGFGIGVFRWNTRVEAYLLLLHDEYPPFSLTPD